MAERGRVGAEPPANPPIEAIARRVDLHALDIDNIGAIQHTERGGISDLRHECAQQRPCMVGQMRLR